MTFLLTAGTDIQLTALYSKRKGLSSYHEDTQIFVKDAEQLSSAVQQLHSYIIDVYQMSNKACAYHIQCAFLKT